MKNLCLLPMMVVVVFKVLMVNANTITPDKLTLITPDPRSGGFTQDIATDITFNLAYSVTGSVTPGNVKVSFRDRQSNDFDSLATAVGGNAPDGTTVTTSGTYIALTATMTINGGCATYFELCALILLAGPDPDVSGDDATCIDFGVGADKAGTKTCNDIAATTLTLTTPDPATGGFTQGTPKDITFHLAYTVIAGGGTPSAIKVYFSDATGSVKSTEVTAEGDSAPSLNYLVDVTSSGTYTALTATVTLASNCEFYTKFCAAIEFTTSHGILANDDACNEFGVGADKAGTKWCNAGSSVTTSSTLMVLTMIIGVILSWEK